MSTPTATQQPAPHSALRRLVARHPVAAFLVMVYAVNIAVVLPPVLTRHDIWPFGQALSDPLGHIFGSAVPAFLVIAAMHGRAGVRVGWHRCTSFRTSGRCCSRWWCHNSCSLSSSPMVLRRSAGWGSCRRGCKSGTGR